MAGHAKWQNIASTKKANDVAKGRLVSRYVMMVRRAIISQNRQADPKLNSKLAQVLAEASKLNVPKATLERAIQRAVNAKIFTKNLEIQGPQGAVVIVHCETDNTNTLRSDIKKIIRKHDCMLANDDTLIGMFQSRGFLRAATKTIDQREVDLEYAEEAAIVGNAEEVMLEENNDATDSELQQLWVFTTDANNLGPCKGELEKLNLKIISSDLNLVPYREIDFGEETYRKVMTVVELLRENESVVDVYHNLKRPEGYEE